MARSGHEVYTFLYEEAIKYKYHIWVRQSKKSVTQLFKLLVNYVIVLANRQNFGIKCVKLFRKFGNATQNERQLTLNKPLI